MSRSRISVSGKGARSGSGLSHYCTIRGTRFERNVKVTDVFPEEINNPALNKKEFDGIVFEGRAPRVIFEVNVAEHVKIKSESDPLKMQLAKSKGINLILVPNQFVKHYEYIRELMIKIKGGVYQKTLFEV